MSGGYCENDTNMLLNRFVTFDHFCIQNEAHHTKIYIHITIIADRITMVNPFSKTINAGASAYANA